MLNNTLPNFCHLQKDCTPWIQIPTLFRGANSLAEGMPWSNTHGWFGPWLGQNLGMKCAPEHRLEVVGSFPRRFFGGVSQNGNLLKLKPFTGEGLSEQSSRLRGERKSRKSEWEHTPKKKKKTKKTPKKRKQRVVRETAPSEKSWRKSSGSGWMWLLLSSLQMAISAEGF